MTRREIEDVIQKIDKCMAQKASDMDLYASKMAYSAKEYSRLKSLNDFLQLLYEYPNDENLNNWLLQKDDQLLNRKIIEHFKENKHLEDVFQLI